MNKLFIVWMMVQLFVVSFTVVLVNSVVNNDVYDYPVGMEPVAQVEVVKYNKKLIK